MRLEQPKLCTIRTDVYSMLGLRALKVTVCFVVL